MITIKSQREFAKMVVAGEVVAEVLATVADAARPGVTLLELDSLAERIIRGRGCVPSFLGYRGYPNTLCLSPNDVIVHGIPTTTKLRTGDLLSIDAGAIYEGLHGDAALTIAIGQTTPQIESLLVATQTALYAGIAKVQPGSRVGDIGAAVQAVGEANSLGVVVGYGGHGIGRQMHEEPHISNVGVAGRGHKLRTGMAICIEPMFNLGLSDTKVDDDGWTVRTLDGSRSAHFEHTVALTPDGVAVTTLAKNEKLPDLVGLLAGG